eukprot:g78294.t1
MPRHNRALRMQPSAEAAEWIDVSWEALMEALALAVIDNERMIMKERAQQFPPPYAIAQEEKKTMVATSVMPSDGGEDQTGSLSVIRRDRGPREQTTQVERKVGTWEEMKTTVTVGGELLTSAMEGEEPEEERKPPNTPMGDDPASMMAVDGEEQNGRDIYLDSGSSRHLVPEASMLDDREEEGLDLRGIDGPTKAMVMGKMKFVGKTGQGKPQQVTMGETFCLESLDRVLFSAGQLQKQGLPSRRQ